MFLCVPHPSFPFFSFFHDIFFCISPMLTGLREYLTESQVLALLLTAIAHGLYV